MPSIGCQIGHLNILKSLDTYQFGLQSYYHVVLGWYTMCSVWSGKSIENAWLIIHTTINAFQSLVFHFYHWRDAHMVSMSYLQWHFSSVCIPEHSAFQVCFHDCSGLGLPFYFWYEIDLVSCWLLCYIHANPFSWSWSWGFTEAKQCTLWQMCS